MRRLENKTVHVASIRYYGDSASYSSPNVQTVAVYYYYKKKKKPVYYLWRFDTVKGKHSYTYATRENENTFQEQLTTDHAEHR